MTKYTYKKLARLLTLCGLSASLSMSAYASGLYHASGNEKQIETGFYPGGPFVDPQVTYEVIDGMAIFGGDIILGPANQFDGSNSNDTMPQSVIQTEYGKIWINGVVPYQIDEALSDETVGEINQAIAHWEDNTGFSFILRNEENSPLFPDYVSFVTREENCASYVGRRGREQLIQLSEGCNVSNIVHEIGHTIGFWHEQSREDRDQFVTIIEENICSGETINFNQHTTMAMDVGPYDYDSIMHYPTWALGCGGPTIEVPEGINLDDNDELSPGDIFAAHVLLGWAPNQVAAGDQHTCVINSNLGVSCWGDNTHGQTVVPTAETLVPVIITAGANHTCTLSDKSGEIACWGANDSGQTTVPNNLENPVSVSAGANHNCAVHGLGDVTCWGGNQYGQSTVPGNLAQASIVTSGTYHSCALTIEGVECWGSNSYGQSAVPPNLSNPRAVAAGDHRTCVIDDNGVTCWGFNTANQDSIPFLNDPSSIELGMFHTCALDRTGVKCWGYDGYGESTVPSNLEDPVAVSAGKHHTCAKHKGGISCWGNDSVGESTPVASDPVLLNYQNGDIVDGTSRPVIFEFDQPLAYLELVGQNAETIEWSIEAGATDIALKWVPTTGENITVRAYSYDLNNQTVVQSYDFTTVLLYSAELTSPTDASTLAGSQVEFTLAANLSDRNNYLWLGSSAMGIEYDSHTFAPGETSWTASNLPTDGSTLHATLVYEETDGEWVFKSYSYTTHEVTTTSSINLPVDGTTLSSDGAFFQIDPALNVTHRLWLGSTQGGYDYGNHIFTAGEDTWIASGLPTNGETIHAMLWYSDENGDLVQSFYTYTASSGQ